VGVGEWCRSARRSGYVMQRGGKTRSGERGGVGLFFGRWSDYKIAVRPVEGSTYNISGRGYNTTNPISMSYASSGTSRCNEPILSTEKKKKEPQISQGGGIVKKSYIRHVTIQEAGSKAKS